MTTRIAVNPSEDGNCSMKSMEIEFQGLSGIGSCWRLPYGLCRGCFGPSASRARLTIVLDKRADIWPCIIPSDKIQCLVLTIMTRDRVIMTVE